MEEWGPVDWRGDDGKDFFKGMVIGLVLATPFWLGLAYLLGVF